MTTITLNIKDESKVRDVLRFLGDIDFLEVSEPVRRRNSKDSSRALIGELLNNPLVVKGFSPIARERIHER